MGDAGQWLSGLSAWLSARHQGVWSLLAPLAGSVVGFISAWLLFEFTERRKVRMAHDALRQALIAELEHAEVLLASNTGKYAHCVSTPEEVKRVAAEIRWFVNIGADRLKEAGVGRLPGGAERSERLAALSDEDLVRHFVQAGRRETVGSALPLPVLDSVLAGRTPGFSGSELLPLTSVR